LDSYPEYIKTSRLDELRATEYAYLDEQDHLYLDYTGSGLAAKSQFQAHAARLAGNLFGNPHSASPTSEAATARVQQTRLRILQHLNASPDEYAVIFTQNASGAARLVGEAYPFRRTSRLVMTFDNHNSVNGVREFARRRGARAVYVPSTRPDLRVDTAAVNRALKDRFLARCTRRKRKRSGLFAYPAQSNFSGVRHPLTWIGLAQKKGYDVLLDAAAYLPTGTLDLSDLKPEFVIVSWYKLFGYPTGVGCLIGRKDALRRLERPWFAGGTVLGVTVGAQWHALADDETAFEDGTLNFLSIPDVAVGLDWLADVGMSVIQTRVRCLTGWFLDRLLSLRHSDGTPMAVVYGPEDMVSRGSPVSFNFIDAAGKIVDERLVALESAAARISLRTGCFCNPGASENAFGLNLWSLLGPASLGQTTNLDQILRRLGMPTGGAFRISFGVASTAADVHQFFAFAETYRDRVTSADNLAPRERC
jgi:selenocysteine lyase/cysteine desulfurase